MANLPGRFGYQLGVWATTLLRVANVVRFLRRENRVKLFLAHEILAGRLPVVDLERIVDELPDEATISVSALQYRKANCAVVELFVLAAITRLIGPLRSIEIGTHDGRSTLAIAANGPPRSIVHTLNLPPDYASANPLQRDNIDVQLSAAVVSGHRFADHEFAGRIRQHFGDSKKFDFAPLMPAQFVFIDGGHDFETAMSDSRNALRGIDRVNGAILWDDAEHYGLPNVLAKLRAEGLPIKLIAGTDMAILRFRNGVAVEY